MFIRPSERRDSAADDMGDLVKFIRPSEQRAGAMDDMGDLVEFNRPSERRGHRATIHRVSKNRPFIG